jgi:8-oxo-dGTP diphosphatase
MAGLKSGDMLVDGHSKPLIKVACGVLKRPNGEVLLAQRPSGKIAAGYWEFPGGKIEPGETALAALKRELQEELAVHVERAEPLIRFRHEYSNRIIELDTWLVEGFSGALRACEGQTLRWLHPGQFHRLEPLLPTVAPTAVALRMPEHYVLTPPTATPEQIAAQLSQLPAGAMLRLRSPQWSDTAYAAAAEELVPAAQALGLMIVLDRDPALVGRLGADGWHCRSAQLMTLMQRPAVPLAIASVHDADQLDAAERLGFEVAVLGPVLPTISHPEALGLGWTSFAALRGERALSVYAIGGVHAPLHRAEAKASNAQGLAGISAYWR